MTPLQFFLLTTLPTMIAFVIGAFVGAHMARRAAMKAMDELAACAARCMQELADAAIHTFRLYLDQR